MSARDLRGRWESGLVPIVVASMSLAVFLFPGSAEAAKSKAVNPVKVGLGWFVHTWAPNDSLARGGDGLGPMFNARSCSECHHQGGIGGGGGVNHNVQILAVELRNFGRGKNPHDPLVKRVLQVHPGLKEQPAVVMHRFGTSRLYTNWRAERLNQVPGENVRAPSILAAAAIKDVLSDEFSFANGPFASFEPPNSDRLLRQPANRSKATNRSFNDPVVMRLTDRNTSAIFGSGLIDGIPDAVIIAQLRAKNEDEHHHGGVRDPAQQATERPVIKGKVSILPDGRVGRFGWKAQHASLAEFTETACAVEVGLQVPGHDQGGNPQSTNYRSPGLDMNRRDVDQLVAFVSSLPAPQQIVPDYIKPYTATHGELEFEHVGCADCHVRTVGKVDGIYSDLLVHDMGGSFGDVGYYSMFVSEFVKNGSKAQPPDPTKQVAATEWRTPPLWGVADSAPYMHDGRAATLEDAIVAHEGTALWSSQQYQKLEEHDKEALLWFLRSLKAPSGEQMAVAIANVERKSAR